MRINPQNSETLAGTKYIIIGTMGRKYYKDKPYSAKALEVIAKHYNELKQKLCPIACGNYAGRITEDIFSDTICVVIQDEAAMNLRTETEILKLFEYRFKRVSFQVIRDNKEDMLQYEERISGDGYKNEAG